MLISLDDLATKQVSESSPGDDEKVIIQTATYIKDYERGRSNDKQQVTIDLPKYLACDHSAPVPAQLLELEAAQPYPVLSSVRWIIAIIDNLTGVAIQERATYLLSLKGWFTPG